MPNAACCHRKAHVRRETETERLKRDEMQTGSLWYHIMAKRGKVANYGKPNYIKETVR